MDSTVWIALIIAAAVIVILFMFRPALKKFFLRADQGGIEAGIETREVPAAQDVYKRQVTHPPRSSARTNPTIAQYPLSG